MGSNPRMVAPAKETFESKFWRYLNDARFREWAPVAGTSGDAYEGQSPHGAMLKMYLSRKAAGRLVEGAFEERHFFLLQKPETAFSAVMAVWRILSAVVNGLLDSMTCMVRSISAR